MQSCLLAQLSAFCTAHPVRMKVLFVPTPQVGYTLTEALAASGQAWANLRVSTLDGWAEREIGLHLRAEGWTSLSEDADRFLVEDLLSRLPDGGAWAGRSGGPGLVRSFQRTLHALRMAGVAPDGLHPGGEPGRIRVLAALYRQYCGHLEAGRLFDHARLFERATERLRRKPEPGDSTAYAILDETPVGGRAFEYLRACAGSRLFRIGQPDCGIAPPAQSAAARFPEAPFPDAGPLRIGPGGALLSRGLSPKDAETLALRQALGAENEVRGVLREILDRGLPLDAVEIACTVASPYTALLFDAAERFDLPVAFASGVPVGLTRPGQALTGFLQWVGSGYAVAELAGLCRARLLTFGRVLEAGEILHPERAGHLLLRARAEGGREPYEAAFDRLEGMLREQAADLLNEGMPREQIRSEHEDLARLRQVVAHMFSLLPEGRSVSVRALAESAARFLETFVPTRSRTDERALESLPSRLRDIGENVDLADEPARLAARLDELLSAHTVAASAARPGHLYVAPIERAGYSGREHLYVLGMDEGSFPGGGTEDPLLLDDERARVSAELAFHRTRPAEQVWHLVRLLGAAPGSVTLLASRLNLADGRETVPAALFQQAAAQMQVPDAPPISAVPLDPKAALDDAEAWLAVRRTAGFRESVAAAFPWLAAGETAMRARELPALTRYDGDLGAGLPEAGGADRVLSASRLETLARCPYRYFLRYVLHVQPPDEPEDDPSRWLSPLEFGSLLHGLFCAFMQRLDARNERPDLEKHAGLLNDMLHTEIERYQEQIPVRYKAAFRADVRRLERAARVFLSSEARRREGNPVGFEVSFGFGEAGGLNRETPVPIRLGNLQLRLRGRIDRVDRTAHGYEIWDYKTGSAANYDERDLLKKGTHLQWALYAYALEQILSDRKQTGRVHTSGYFFASDREHGRRFSDAPPAPSELGELLSPLFEMASSGCFFHVQKEDQCTFCDYNRLCAPEQRLPKDMDAIREAMANRPDRLAPLERWMRT